MKAYSFSFNTSDWLASPAVRLMSKAERGVYINLLALAWEAPQQGTLPASADKVRRMAEMDMAEWAESGETILEKFPLSECGTYRYNPRLLAEAARQETKRETNAEAGRRSAEKRAAERAARNETPTPPAAPVADSLQPTGNENPTPVEIEPTDVEKNPTISKGELSKELKEKASKQREQILASPPASQPQTTEQKGGAAPKPAAPASAPSKPAEYRCDEAPCFLTTDFFELLTKLGFGHVNRARYLLKIQRGAAEAVESKKRPEFATNAAWEKFIERWLENDEKNGTLLLPDPHATYSGPNPALQVVPPRMSGKSLPERIKAQATRNYN